MLMKALSVKQPWAWGLVTGLKTIENRTWKTSHRGPLLIHAGKSTELDPLAPPFDLLFPGLDPADLIYQSLIGIVDIIDCVPLADAPVTPFTQGPYCWICANPRPIRPIPCAGKQRLFSVSLPPSALP